MFLDVFESLNRHVLFLTRRSWESSFKHKSFFFFNTILDFSLCFFSPEGTTSSSGVSLAGFDGASSGSAVNSLHHLLLELGLC